MTVPRLFGDLLSLPGLHLVRCGRQFSFAIFQSNLSVFRPKTYCGRHLSFSRRASLLAPRPFLKKTFRPGVHPILRGCGSFPDLITCGAKRGASCLKIFVEKIRGKLNCGRTVTIPRLGTEMVSPRGASTVQPRATVTVQRRGSAKRPCRGVVGAGGSHGDGRWAHAEAAA